MGQIIGSSAKPKRCNLQSLSSLGTPAAGEHILVSSDNSMNAAGQGNFDCYIEGDNTHLATELPLKSIDGLLGRSLEQFLIEEYDGLLTHTTIKRFSYASNYSLVGDGHWVSNSGFLCEKFNVTGGSLLKVKLAKDSAGVYQFQTVTSNPTATGSTANVVGIGNLAVDGYLRVPDNAVCLVVSRATTTTTNSVELIEPAEQDNFPSSDSGHLITSRGVAEGIIVGGMKADQIDADYHQYHGQCSSAGAFLDNTEKFYIFPVKSGQHVVLHRTEANINRTYLKSFAGQPTTGYVFEQSSESGYTITGRSDFNEDVPSDANYLYVHVNYGLLLPEVFTIDGYDMLTGLKTKIANIEASNTGAEEKANAIITSLRHSLTSVRDLNRNYGWQNENKLSGMLHTYDTELSLREIANTDSTWEFVEDTIFHTGLKLCKCTRGGTSTSSAVTGKLVLGIPSAELLELQNQGKHIQVCVELYSEWGYILRILAGGTTLYTLSDYNWRDGKRIILSEAFPATSIGTTDSQRYLIIDIGGYAGHEIYVGRVQFIVTEDATQLTTLPYTLFSINHEQEQSIIGSVNGNSADIVKANNPAKCEEYFRQSRKVSNTLNIAFFSDIHSDAVNYERYKQFVAAYQDKIDCLLHGGDSVQVNSTSDFTFWNDSRILNVIGNHDVLDGSNQPTMTEAEACAKYFTPFIENWGVTHTDGTCYYYKDFAKVRLIVLDIMHTSTAQTTFLTSALTGAKTAGLSVLICEHYPIGTDMVYERKSAWCSARNSTNVGVASDWKSAVNTFIDSGGTFIAWLCGHTHYDILAHDATYPNQWCIAVGTARGTNSADSDYTRTTGVQSQDLFNIISIDATNGLLTMWRVGAQVDKYLRVHEPICLDYRNGEIL